MNQNAFNLHNFCVFFPYAIIPKTTNGLSCFIDGANPWFPDHLPVQLTVSLPGVISALELLTNHSPAFKAFEHV